MGKQFVDVSCKYGAPMGRHTYGIAGNVDGKISLFHVTLCQGYDDGGAYWGCATSYKDQLYCARSVESDDDFFQFIRAESREAARVLLDIEQEQLVRPTKGKKHADRNQ